MAAARDLKFYCGSSSARPHKYLTVISFALMSYKIIDSDAAPVTVNDVFSSSDCRVFDRVENSARLPRCRMMSLRSLPVTTQKNGDSFPTQTSGFRLAAYSIGCVFCWTSCAVAWAAPVQWTSASGGNDHFYEAILVPNGISWSAANTSAQAGSGYLATITSPDENSFIFNLITSFGYWKTVGSGTRGPWIGGFQLSGSTEPDQGWQWGTGESFGYANWAVGQPDNNGNEDKLHFYASVPNAVSAQWNDLPDDNGSINPIGYIVESVPEPSFMVWFISGLGTILFKLIRFRLSVA